MRRFGAISLLFMLLLTTSCLKNEVTVQCDISGDESNSYPVLWFASSRTQAFYSESVLALHEGKGTLRIPTKYPTLVFLFKGSDPCPVLFFYAERGDKIEITGDFSDPIEWNIGGNAINSRLSAWRKQNKDLLRRSRFEPGVANDIVSRYVKSHPDDPVSAILLLCVYSRTENEAGFAELWNSLEGKARDDKLMAAVSRSDLIDFQVKKPQPLKDMIFPSVRGHDTLHIVGTSASILYFSGFGSNTAASDSLGALAREYPDTTRRVIADIFIEPDSLSWRRTAEKDTISTHSRVWVPLSFADGRISSMGVNRSGIFIVADSKGKQIYRGSKTEKALSEFRRLMKR